MKSAACTVVSLILFLASSFATAAESLQLSHAHRVSSLVASEEAVDAAMDSDLAVALKAKEPLHALAAAGFRVADNRVQVVVTCEENRGSEVLAWLDGMGANRLSTAGARIQAHVKPSTIAELLTRLGVEWVGRPNYAVLPEPAPPAAPRSKILVVSEGVEEINAPAWHGQGITGEGVKVGVIDSQFGGWEDLVGVELPVADKVHFTTFTSQPVDGEVHGTACAEIVHDVAPGAELYLAMVSSTTDMSQAVDWMTAEGVSVITMSLSWFTSGPGDGTGIIAEVVDGFVNDHGGVWFNSAGNYRSSHYQGTTDDVDGDGWVEAPSGDEVVRLARSLGAGDVASAHLVWNDWTEVNQDYSLHLFLLGGDEPVEVDVADRLQTGSSGHRPWEILTHTVAEAGAYGYGVLRKNVTDIHDMELTSFEQSFDEPVESGSITPPSDTLATVSVAALATSGGFGYRSFSSAGPSNGPGGSLAGGAVKPDVGGYDGVSTVSYGTQAFFGTSAASPHAGGAAALVLQANPGFSGVELRAFIEDAAIDKGDVGKDNDYGHGRLNLGVAPGQNCQFTVSPAAVSIAAGGGLAVLAVAAESDCFWSVEASTAWMRASPDGNTGGGIVAVIVDANTELDARQGTVTIGGIVVPVDQLAAGCDYEVGAAVTSYPAEGGQGTVNVTVDDGCTWSALADVDWLVINGGNGVEGSGSGTVELTVSENFTADDRAGTLTVAETAIGFVQAGAAERVRLVAGIADSAGAAGTRWSSNLALLNRSGAPASVTLSYGLSSASVDLADGEIVEWQDVAQELFQVDGDSSGSVEVRSALPLVVTARTFNTSENGTFGQYLPGVSAAEALGDGSVGVLSQIKSTDDFRTNIGAVNLSSETVEIEVRLFDGDGNAKGEALILSIAPGEWKQQNRVFTDAGVDGCEIGYAMLTVLTPGGLVWPYASVVDNHSGDPTTVPLVLVPADDAAESVAVVAGIAASAGAAGTQWSSNLAALNSGSQSAEVSLMYRHQGGSVEVTQTLLPGQIMEWQDVARGLFDVAGDSSGSVELSSDRPLVITARTFNSTPDGTFGQLLPGVEQPAALAGDSVALLPQIKRTDDFRTNVGMINLGNEQCTVEVVLHGADGEPKGTPVNIVAGPGAWTQRNRIFSAAGVAECPVGYATVTVLTADCPVWVYASVVDNLSGDPTTIPQVIEGL